MAIRGRRLFTNRRKCAFYSVAAQEDNLGDIIIRLRMLGWIKDSFDETFVYVGQMSDSYLQPFDLDASVKIIQTKSQLVLEIAKSIISKRVFLVFPPGPSSFGGVKNWLRSLATILAVVALAAGGGGTLQAGTSFRKTGRGGAKIQELKTRLFRVCIVRDSKSNVSSRVEVAPDLAFSFWTPVESSNRFRLSVSYRSDYDIDEQILLQLKGIAESNGWRLTFVSQVGRDDTRHLELAKRLNADVIAWEGTHQNQLERVRKAYAESVALITDRLHGLIFSSNSGALPVALIHAGNDKLSSTFDPVMALTKVESGTGEIPKSVVDAIQSSLVESGTRLRRLGELEKQLEKVKDRIQNALD